MQFAKLSPSGAQWTAEQPVMGREFPNIVLGDWGNAFGRVVGVGISPQWLDDDTVIWAHGRDVRRLRDGGDVDTLATLERSLNGLCTNQAGAWVAWSAQAVWNGAAWREGCSQPAVSPSGAIVMVTDDSRLISTDGSVSSGGPVRLPRFGPSGSLAWVEEHNRQFQAFPRVWAPWQIDAHAVLPVRTSLGDWLVVLENERLVCHPKGDPFGYVIRSVPDSNRPDAVGVGDHLRVAWDYGDIRFADVDLTQPRVNLAPVLEVWEPAEPLVDVWPYLAGPDNAWPRIVAGDPGNRMDRIIEAHGGGRQSVTFVKFGDPQKWERWMKEKGFIWHYEDHIADHRGDCYAFSDGRWLRGRMVVGEIIDAPGNTLRWWRNGGWTPWEPFPYRMTLLAHERERTSGRMRIRFAYDPGSSRDTIEHYVCELGLGWTGWQEVNQKTGVVTSGSEWRERLDAVPVLPQGARVPVVSSVPSPTPMPTKITITEPSSWPVEINPGQAVRCVYAVTQGSEPAKVVWTARLDVGALTTVTNAGWDNDHTFKLVAPGRYAITLRALDGDGHELDATGKLREIVVRDLAQPPAPQPEPEPTPQPPSMPDEGGLAFTLEQIRHWRSAIALDKEFFSLMFLQWDDAKQERYIARCLELGLTHVVILFSGGYRDRFPMFDAWNDIPRLRRGLLKLHSAGLIPALCASNPELAGRGGKDVANKIIAQWERTLPHVADLLPAAIPAVEQNDFLSPEAQHMLALALARLLPDAYRAIWFTGDRSHGDHNRGTGPDGEPPAAWKPSADEDNPGQSKAMVPGYWGATPAAALFYQSDKWQDERDFVDDLGDVSVRVNGRVDVPGKHAPYPGMRKDVIYAEGPAEAILSGDVTYAQCANLRRAALSVPGITGVGD